MLWFEPPFVCLFICLFSIPATVSPPSFSSHPLPPPPLCTFSIYSSVSVQKRASLPWVSAKYGRSGCSKTKHLPLCLDWLRQFSMRRNFLRARQSIRHSLCSYYEEFNKQTKLYICIHLYTCRGFRSVPFRLPGCWLRLFELLWSR